MKHSYLLYDCDVHDRDLGEVVIFVESRRGGFIFSEFTYICTVGRRQTQHLGAVKCSFPKCNDKRHDSR